MSRGRNLRWMLAASIAVPVVLFALIAIYDHFRVLSEVTNDAWSAAAILREQTIHVVEQHDLLLRTLDERVRGMSWDEIEHSADLRRELQAIPSRFPHISGIALADASGRLRAASSVAGDMPQVNISDRDYFIAQQRANAGVFLSAPYVGRISGVPNLALSLRRSSEDGQFDGTIHVAVDVDYFVTAWRAIAKPQGLIPLIRSDGQVLARYPATDASRLAPASPFMRAVAGSPDDIFRASSALDGVERITAYRKVGRYPAFIACAVPVASATEIWLRHLVLFGGALGIAAIALATLVMVALREVDAKERALGRLAAEMALREAAEAQLRHAQRMEAIGQLTGGVAHYFNNLLTVIIGSLDLLEGQVPTDAGKRLIAAARRGVDRGARITDALLAFSRRQMLQPQAIDVNQLIGGFAELLQQTAGDAVEMRLALRAMTPWCRIDPAPFQTALLNLVANARDAMLPHGGSIVIETEDARLDACDPEAAYDHIALTVRDEGAGMSPDTLERAFEPFFTTKDIETASGLGLSQVFGFVKQSGGQVQLMSKPGIGTAVRLYLPRDARGTSGPDDGDAAAPQPARPTGKDEPVAVLGGRSASPSTERCCATG